MNAGSLAGSIKEEPDALVRIDLIEGRSEGIVVIQVTELGRDQKQKQALYAALAHALEERAAVRPQERAISS